MRIKGVRVDVFILAALIFGTLLAMLAFAPFISLETPTEGQPFLTSNSVTFNCTVNDTDYISNISLYHDINGSFILNKTRRYGWEIPNDEQGLVLLLHFNNDSSVGENSTYIYDYSGNGNNGQVINAVYNSTGGKFNGGYEFYNVFSSGYPENESIEIPDSDSLDLTTEGSIEAWIRPIFPTQTLEWTILTKGDNYDEFSSYQLGIQISSSKCYVRFYIGNGITSQTPLSNNSLDCSGKYWSHVAATWDNSNIKLYINGTLDRVVEQTVTPFDSSGVLRIGKNTLNEFKFNGTIDEIAIFNRTLSAEEIAIHAAQLPTNTSKTWTINNIPDGNYTWNCLSSDNNSESNFSSANKSFLVDINPPIFLEILNYPSDEDGLDPGTTINITANFSERFGTTAILQYKQSGVGTWTNATMTNTSANFFNASFTPGTNGNWSYRIFANDSFGHANTSSQTNLTIEYDYTWSRSPADFGIISGFLDTTRSIGILTINNTGDNPLNFDLGNNAPSGMPMAYNYSEPFDLAAKEIRFINISATYGSTTREDPVTITITTTSGNPLTAIANVTLASYAGGPYFDVRITEYAATVNQSSRMNLSAYVKNVGNQTSTNTWLNFSLPSGWTNITGNMSFYIGNLTADATAYNNITANITTSASAGVATIMAIAACNESITDNETKTVTVSCSNTDGVCGTGCTYLTDSDCPQETVTISSGGGGGGGTAGGATSAVGEKEIKISKRVHLSRGTAENFTIDVQNTFKDSIIYNATIKITGFLAQYIDVNPLIISRIDYNQTGRFVVKVSAPPYSSYANHTLQADIEGIIIESKVNVTSRTNLKMTQYIALIIHEITEEKIKEIVNSADSAVKAMIAEGFSARKAQSLLEKAKNHLKNYEYEQARDTAIELEQLKEQAFASNKLIESLKKSISKAESEGISAEETKTLLSMAIAAFEREDYAAAEERARQAEVTFALEAEGKFNLLNFIKINWLYVLLALIALSTASFFAWRKATILIVKNRIQALSKEESSIIRLMKELQADYFDKHAISTGDYFNAMAHYHKRLTKIKTSITRLRSRETKILSVDKEIMNLQRENQAVLNLIKKAQQDYFEKKTITKAEYEMEIEAEQTRLAEIEEAMALINAMMAKEKAAKKNKHKNMASFLEMMERHGRKKVKKK
ncbi:MAG: hypothetical protein KJ955_02855 [Nanoarchaeota archaeon]|nr:hypothetical protein [Nanoarchaeota archaeon]